MPGSVSSTMTTGRLTPLAWTLGTSPPTLVTLLEGAQVLGRWAAGSVAPFDAVTRVARGLVA